MRPSEIVILEVKQKRRRHRGLSGFGTNNYLETLGKNQKPQEETPQTENPYVEEVSPSRIS